MFGVEAPSTAKAMKIAQDWGKIEHFSFSLLFAFSVWVKSGGRSSDVSRLGIGNGAKQCQASGTVPRSFRDARERRASRLDSLSARRCSTPCQSVQ